MDDVELANYFAGLHSNDIFVAATPAWLAPTLGLTPGAPIYLSDYTIVKCSYKHSNIKYEDYLKLPKILRLGFVVSGRKTRDADCYYVESSKEPPRSYQACLTGAKGDKGFVVTFHRQKLSELRRIYRKAVRTDKLLRRPSMALARLLESPRQ